MDDSYVNAIFLGTILEDENRYMLMLCRLLQTTFLYKLMSFIARSLTQSHDMVVMACESKKCRIGNG